MYDNLDACCNEDGVFDLLLFIEQKILLKFCKIILQAVAQHDPNLSEEDQEKTAYSIMMKVIENFKESKSQPSKKKRRK